MKRRRLLATAAALPLATKARADEARGPILVELFTSQGCSSCPRADVALARLVGRSDVLPLAFHVTYWDNLGWRDTLGDARCTARQQWYASLLGTGPYTPQMVVAGRVDIVGSDARLEPFLAALGPDHRPAAIAIDGNGTAHLPSLPAGTRLLAVRYLPVITVDILRGENAGESITYRNAVRDLAEMATAGPALDLSALAAPGEGLAVIAQSPDGTVLATGSRLL
ncbi:MAG: DUF1223 domain-containing protein [Geminicoccaceae bacterium]